MENNSQLFKNNHFITTIYSYFGSLYLFKIQ